MVSDRLLKDRARRAERYAIIDKYRAQPCADCQRYYPWFMMDLDHRPGTVKVAPVSSLASRMAPISVLLAEIEKCDPVCANCHRARSHKRDQFRSGREK